MRTCPKLRLILLPLAVVFSSLLVLLPGAPANAEDGDVAGKFKVNDDDPVGSAPTPQQRDSDPLSFGLWLQDVIARAEGGFRSKDYAKAAKFYEAIAKAVPSHALPYSRLCESYGNLGKVEQAIPNCAKAVARGGARVRDHFELIQLIMRKDQLTPGDLQEVDASLTHLRAHVAKREQGAAAPNDSALTTLGAAPPPASATPPNVDDVKPGAKPGGEPVNEDARSTAQLGLDIELLACKVGVRLADAKRMESCVQALRTRKADPPMILAFDWSSALIHKDPARAAKLLDDAKRLGLQADTLSIMTAEQLKSFPGSIGLSPTKKLGLAASIAFVLLMAVLSFTRWQRNSRKRPKPEPTPPASATPAP